MAWVNAYDTAEIQGSKSPKLLDNQSRTDKKAIQERMNDGVDKDGTTQTDGGDHYWPLTGDVVSNANAGQHRKVCLRKVASNPDDITDAIVAFSKDVDNVPELHTIDEDENVCQITSGGAINPGAITDGDITQRPTQVAGAAEDDLTVSDTWTDLANMSLTFTTTGGDVLINFNATFQTEPQAANLGRLHIRILLDDVEIHRGSIVLIPSSSYYISNHVSLQFLKQSLSAAEHVWKVQYYRAAGDWVQQGGDNDFPRILHAIEFKK